MLAAELADAITLSGLVIDGGRLTLPKRSVLARLSDVRALDNHKCVLLDAGGNAVPLWQCDGAVTHTTITGAADNSLFCFDSGDLIIAGKLIRGSGNGGIRVWQSERRRDGSLIEGNRIEDSHARAGGSGQNGNAIHVFRADNVIGGATRSAPPPFRPSAAMPLPTSRSSATAAPSLTRSRSIPNSIFRAPSSPTM